MAANDANGRGNLLTLLREVFTDNVPGFDESKLPHSSMLEHHIYPAVKDVESTRTSLQKLEHAETRHFLEKLSLLGKFSRQVMSLKNTAEMAWRMWEFDPQERPSMGQFIEIFIENCGIFAPNTHLGFIGPVRKSIRYIQMWNTAGIYHDVIAFMWRTPVNVPMGSQRYSFRAQLKLNIRTYLDAAKWSKAVISIAKTNHPSRGNVQIMEYLWSAGGSNQLQKYIGRLNGKLPFHVVVKRTDEESRLQEEIMENILNEKRQMAIAAALAANKKLAATIANLTEKLTNSANEKDEIRKKMKQLNLENRKLKENVDTNDNYINQLLGNLRKMRKSIRELERGTQQTSERLESYRVRVEELQQNELDILATLREKDVEIARLSNELQEWKL